MLNKKISTYYLAISLLTVSTSIIAAPNLSSYQMNYEKGEYKKVISDLEQFKVINFTPEHFELYVSSLSQLDLDDAEKAAEKAIITFSDNADMYLMHASVMGSQASESIFSALGYAKKALKSLETATRLEPDNPKYLNGLMSFYLMAPGIAGGDTDKALTLAEDIAKLDELKGITAKARYFSAIDDYDSAYNIVKKGITDFPNQIQLYAQLADLYLREEKYSDAIDTYIETTKFSISHTPDTQNSEINIKYEEDVNTLYNAHYQVGRIALLAQMRYTDGIDHLDTYIGLNEKSNIDLSTLPSINWALLRKSGLLYASNNNPAAKTTLEQISNTKESKQFEKTYKKLAKRIKRG